MHATIRLSFLFIAFTLAGCARIAFEKVEPAVPLEDQGDFTVYGAAQPAFESLRSPIRARVLDRRFRTKEAMYLANEMNIGGDPFLQEAFKVGLPIADDTDFQHITAVESYWYSRYNMSVLVAESRLGIHLVHSPYVSEKAIREGIGADNRFRGERIVSNKTELIQRIIPTFLARTGYPRRFEDASPCMLHFASGDPYYPREIDKGTRFESIDNRYKYEQLRQLYGDAIQPPPSGMGESPNEMWTYRINYRENFLTLRWDHDKMEHELDLGAEGQTLMKQILWAEYFFRNHHHRGEYLGNNTEEGFRGAMLTLGAISKMLMLKATMVYDGKRLTGVNPLHYDPQERLLYFPHRIAVRLRYVGDLPPRPEAFAVEDPTSELFDQASLLWGLTEYYYYSDPTIVDSWDRVFGQNPPYDGSILEQKYSALAHGLANLVLANMQYQHLRTDGRLVSSWHPKRGTGDTISTTDLGMSLIALANYHRRMHADQENVTRSGELLREQADFLINYMQAPDGHVADGYNHATQTIIQDGAPTLLAQGFAVRGLLETFKQLQEEKYLTAAKAAYSFMNQELWDAETGVYRSSVGAERTIYTPMNLGAALGAMREMILITKEQKEIDRFKRFWVQGVNSSGIQQAEYEETGERDFAKSDGDGDGIPRMEFAGGRHGIAPVYASKVEIETPTRSAGASIGK